MRVTMLLHITGYRDGEPWPHAGGVIDLPEREARELIAQNYATEAPREDGHDAPNDQPGPHDGDTDTTADAPTDPADTDDDQAGASDEHQPAGRRRRKT